MHLDKHGSTITRIHARTAMTQRPLEPATGAPGQTRVNHYTHTRTHGHHSTAARACDGCTWTNTGQPLHARKHARPSLNGHQSLRRVHLDKHGSTITRTHGHHSTATRACDGCTWTNTGQPLHARTAIAQRPLEPATGAPGQTRVNHYTHARTAIAQRPLEPATGAPGQTRVNHYTHARPSLNGR